MGTILKFNFDLYNFFRAYRIPGLWTQDAGLWMLDSGYWTLDAGLWTLDPEPGTPNAGLLTFDS